MRSYQQNDSEKTIAPDIARTEKKRMVEVAPDDDGLHIEEEGAEQQAKRYQR